MKLQVALDCHTTDEALDILSKVGNIVDIAEIGSVGTFEGFSASREVRKKYPDLEILNDLKIHDGGYSGAKAAYENGANYVTVLGNVDDITILEAVRAGREFGIKIIADMIGCKNLYERLKAVDAMGVDYIAVHIAVDSQSEGNSPLEQLMIAKLVVKHAGISVAGGVNVDNIKDIAACRPDIIVSGNGICGASDPAESARKLKEAMNLAE